LVSKSAIAAFTAATPQYVRKSTDFHKFVDALGMPFGLGFHADSIEQANAFLDVCLSQSSPLLGLFIPHFFS
jgi:hypothetical protein